MIPVFNILDARSRCKFGPLSLTWSVLILAASVALTVDQAVPETERQPIQGEWYIFQRLTFTNNSMLRSICAKFRGPCFKFGAGASGGESADRIIICWCACTSSCAWTHCQGRLQEMFPKNVIAWICIFCVGTNEHISHFSYIALCSKMSKLGDE